MSLYDDLFSDALSVSREVSGGEIICRRGAKSCVIKNAKKLGEKRPQDREGSAALVANEMDWGIGRDDYHFEGDDEPSKPEQNDTFERVNHGLTEIFTVGPRDGKNVFEWSDKGHSQYRVFTTLTKRV